MTASDWIACGGVLGQLFVGAFFMGAIYQTIKNLAKDGARTEKRVDSIELRLNDHTERLSRIETRCSDRNKECSLELR